MGDYRDSDQIFKDLRGLKLWEQRHFMIMKFIEEKNIQTMIDIGCNSGALMQKIQYGVQIKRLIGIDIDQDVLKKAYQTIQPRAYQADLMYARQYDQLVQLYQASALQPYQQLKSLPRLDLISLVQVIEHIYPEDLQKLNENLFGFLRPQYVIITTPNRDFNVLFNWGNNNNRKKQQFRHFDHKFQWTREEFQSYVLKVSQKYSYAFTITGVGLAARQEDEDKGYCTQIVIFERKHKKQDGELLTLEFEPMETQNKQNETQKINTVPLRLIHSHANLSWVSCVQHLIQVAFKQLVYKCHFYGSLRWVQAIQNFKKKTVVKKMQQINDKWRFDYFLKKIIHQKFSTKDWKQDDGVIFSSAQGLRWQRDKMNNESSQIDNQVQKQIQLFNQTCLKFQGCPQIRQEDNNQIKNQDKTNANRDPNITIYKQYDVSDTFLERRGRKGKKSPKSSKSWSSCSSQSKSSCSSQSKSSCSSQSKSSCSKCLSDNSQCLSDNSWGSSQLSNLQSHKKIIIKKNKNKN